MRLSATPRGWDQPPAHPAAVATGRRSKARSSRGSQQPAHGSSRERALPCAPMSLAEGGVIFRAIPASVSDAVIPLMYELPDAHPHTAQIAAEPSCDLSWAAHLDYLRALQRRGREMLAELANGGVV